MPDKDTHQMVRKERLELSRVAPLEPKSSASTSSATFARIAVQLQGVKGIDINGECQDKSLKILA